MRQNLSSGFMIAAPHSGSGKTTITLALMRALKDQGVGPAKAGPDFIDPSFHSYASDSECINLDCWAMGQDLVRTLAWEQSQKGVLIVEAMMGLFDGAANGQGSAAELAEMLGLPIVLVVDTAKQSHSIAALVSGFINFRKSLNIAGVILNQVGSARHETLLREALAGINIEVFGAVYRDDRLKLPARHLGLVQAQEHGDLDGFLDTAAEIISTSVEATKLRELKIDNVAKPLNAERVLPLGQRIAIARDKAFAFTYPHLVDGWRVQGAEVSFFSPLENEAPAVDCDAVYLPGGYPELHAGKISTNGMFLDGVRNAAARDALIYGECGGYMVMGEALIDKDGRSHKMANLLPLVTSFETRKLHLGYRIAAPIAPLPFLSRNDILHCHEFHYSTVESFGVADALFEVSDARQEKLGKVGLRRNHVMGSYMHIIDRAANTGNQNG